MRKEENFLDGELNPVTFGDRLRRAREAAGWSQKAAAERLGVAKARISEYEAGRRSPRATLVLLMIERLGLDPGIVLPESRPAGKSGGNPET
jgi:transcriptional regulator with XRE-family HTH domain